MIVGAAFVCGLSLVGSVAVSEVGEASECGGLGKNKDSSRQLCTQPRPSASRKKTVEAGVPSGRLKSTTLFSVNRASFPALTNLPVHLPEKEGVRRMWRSVENSRTLNSSNSFVDVEDEGGTDTGVGIFATLMLC